MSQPDNPLPASSESTSVWLNTAQDGGRDLTGKTLGDFQVERLLGRGGMGEVYLARQISLNRPVALKVLRPALLTMPTYLSRFEAEATAVAKLNHPNIVHIYTLGSIDGVRFIAMEYVQGTNLKDYLAKKGALDLPLALSIMKQAGQAIGAAGELGLIHRDIKPDNLLLTRKGQIKVADFGLCRDTGSDSLQLTQPGVAMGTPMYMSPEQAQGHPIDHSSDLYSLGVTFYHMLAGQPPFRAETPLALAMKHVKETPVSLTVHRPEIPPELDRLVLKLLAKSPAERYQSAAEMLRDLAKVRESLNTVSMPVPEVDAASLTGASVANGATRPARKLTLVEPGAPKGLGARLGGLRHSRRLTAGVLSLALAAGLAWGWLTRPADLLSPGAPEPEAPPALWMAPNWEAIPRRATAEEQYHYAQVLAPRDELLEAWLAVPGHFPDSREWASRAYIQLARFLLEQRAFAQLAVLADQIDHWKAAQTREKELADIIRAAVAAEKGDIDAVVSAFQTKENVDSLTDPALLELGIEVAGLAQREAADSAPSGMFLDKIGEIRRKLMQKLFFADVREQSGRPLAPGRALFGQRPRPG